MQLTIKLAPERVIGGQLKPGNKVGLSMSYTLEEADAAPTSEAQNKQAAADATTRQLTVPLLTSVLVTRVQNADGGDEESVGVQLITLAVSQKDAQRVVWSVENGKLYLTLQRSGSDVSDTTAIDQTNVAGR